MNAREMGKLMRASLADTIKTIMLVAHDNVTNSTPVDTGHAASNWIMSVGKPDYTVHGSREKVDWTGSANGRAVIEQYKLEDGRIYLRNNVPYLPALNNGHSQQAPPGFVEKALAGASKFAAKGTKRAAGKMLRQLGRDAIKSRGRR